MHHTDHGWILHEWAPNATEIWITGSFSQWELQPRYKFTLIKPGQWELILEEADLHHLDEYKLWITWPGGADYRIPLYATRVVQDENTKIFNAQVWNPPAPEKTSKPNIQDKSDKNDSLALLIYEAHIGMSSETGKVCSFNEFRENILPRIASLGYNTLQLMAIQEHPYYGSFGYHVSSFFAVSSRFGTPDDLRLLIAEAHVKGICVIMDIVHSHAVKNTLEGPGLYDGKPGMLFLTGPGREHPAWDSLCFDYGKDETIHFLLSNCKYWIEEYGFDGFRFDGVTSMLYYDHGLGRDFTSYDAYFNNGVDEDALLYLTLANKLIHELNTHAITIAEDMSGLPGIATPIEDGGLGFDYRLSMGVPDFWIKMLKEKSDESWSVSQIYYELTNRRVDEKTVSYAESHDQALVGDKTIMFRLADKEMYTHMSKQSSSLIIDRAIALDKLIRLLTISTHGGGYLNFMGNEFGHPEWIDFPREGNNWSYKYARRQWHLADNQQLRYGGLQEFDKAMIRLFGQEKIAVMETPRLVLSNDADQVLAFIREPFLFVFNLNPAKSFTHYGIASDPAEYRIVLDSDNPLFGGFGRIDEKMDYPAEPLGKVGSSFQLLLYLPARVGIVLKKTPTRRIR
ncbi:MAG: alpha amylase C-terminal domain-containing protein [Bacteroidales bacterium]|nr:alpha amylase C-terminal domain-containing protein [Bacteroidales bacterium]